MPHFLFAYHGGNTPETEAETEIVMARWQAWFDEISAAVIDPGNPVGNAVTVSAEGVSDDGGANPLSGYTIIVADNIEVAVGMARACPILEEGTIEIAEIHEIEM